MRGLLCSSATYVYGVGWCWAGFDTVLLSNLLPQVTGKATNQMSLKLGVLPLELVNEMDESSDNLDESVYSNHTSCQRQCDCRCATPSFV